LLRFCQRVCASMMPMRCLRLSASGAR
jgi:hypothetical protein